MSTKQPDWNKIKKRSLSGESNKSLSEAFGVSAKSIANKAYREKWVSKKEKIEEEIKQIIVAEALVSSHDVIVELARIAFCDATQIYEPNSNGEGFSLKSLDQIPLDLRRCIKTIEQRPIVTKEDGYIGNAITKVSFYDKVKANELLGKHLGIWKEDIKPAEQAKLPESSTDPLIEAMSNTVLEDWADHAAESPEE